MSIFSDIVERIRSLVFQRRDDRELQDELRFHVDMETAQRQANGADPEEARRQSLAALGGMTRTREEVSEARGTRGATDSLGDVRYALRSLRQRPGFTAVATLTIAIGIGGATAVFSTFDTVILRSLPYRDPGQLVRLYKSSDNDLLERSVVTPVHFLAYRQRLSTMQSVAAMNLYDRTGADIGEGADVRRIRTEIVSADYFDVLRVHPVVGRAFDRAAENGINDDGAPGGAVVVISNRLWRERFHSDPNVVGTSLQMNGRASTVLGVMPDGFTDPLIGSGIDAWIPLDLTPGKDLSNATNHYLSVIGRLQPGVTLARAQAELDAMGKAYIRELAGNASHTMARLYPLKDDVVGDSRGSLQLILGAVGVVLLIVCVNIANLLLVRGSEREREFAMRSALGARRARLLRQLLTESVVLAFAGALLSLPVARILMSAIVALGGHSIPRLDALKLDLPVMLFCAGVAIACSVLFGMVPAWRAAQTQPADVLRRVSRSTTGDRAQGRLRATLVVAQVALAFVLLVGAGLLLASYRKLQSVPLGFTSGNVLAFQMHLPDVRYDSIGRATFYQRLDAAIDAIPGVRAAGATSYLPATGNYNIWDIHAVSGPLVGTEQANSQAEERIVTPGIFPALDVHVITGRSFTAGDNAAAPDRVVLSKHLAEQLFPRQSAIGERIRTGGHNSEVIGVVDDVAVDPEGDAPNTVYHAHDQFAGNRNWSLFEAVQTSGPPAAMIEPVRRALRDIDPQLVMDGVAPLDVMVGQGTAQRAFTLKVLLAFSLVALFLAAIGIFGVLSYTVRLRSPEFGLRLALGATPATILAALLKQAFVITVIGIVIGIAGSLALARVMAAMLFHMSAIDPWVLAAVSVLVAVIGLTAAYLPARRATAVDPREVLM